MRREASGGGDDRDGDGVSGRPNRLADICLGLATPGEFRTEPLTALRFATRFLHDGRATSLEEAIDRHGGEGAPARDRFRALPDADRAAVIAFLKTL